jgi:tetratricopeptide (TPR) repeat protein
LYYKQGDLVQALIDFDKATKANARFMAPYTNRARIYREQGELVKALAEYNKLVTVRPHWYCVYALRGGFLQNWIDRAAEAIPDYDEAIRLRPAKAWLYNNRAWAKKRIGDLSAALADLEKALELDAKHPYVYSSRARIKLMQGDIDGALEDASRAIAFAPPDKPHFYGLYARGLVHEARGNVTLACKDYQAALSAKPEMLGSKDDVEYIAEMERYIARHCEPEA